ncbi:MAG: hypothetical protein H6741_32260 [Alphaproteobacteria bacterium]|nr:hypothetical protein [Alphaproteobacteria bacterium]
MSLLLFSLLPLACGPSVTAEQAADFVTEQARAANPPGRTGLELVGRSRWVRGGMFDGQCLMDKDLAFVENPQATSGIKISPTWANQSYITAETAKGWCVYLGEGLEVTTGKPVAEGGGWKVPVTYTMNKPTPWFECITDAVKSRDVLVNWDPELNLSVDKPLELVAGDCPHPMPEGEVRPTKVKAPTKDAPKAPTKDEVISLMKAFDAKLAERDLAGALEYVSCYNTFSKDTYGSCAPSELIQVAAHKDSEHPGMPWTEAIIAELSDIGRISKDSKLPGVFHVQVTHKRSPRTRSFAVQWTGKEWKLLGVIGAQGADLTSLRFFYDLDDTEKRDIFMRRLEGEEIDEKGNPLNPYAEEEEE